MVAAGEMLTGSASLGTMMPLGHGALTAACGCSVMLTASSVWSSSNKIALSTLIILFFNCEGNLAHVWHPTLTKAHMLDSPGAGHRRCSPPPGDLRTIMLERQINVDCTSQQSGQISSVDKWLRSWQEDEHCS